MVVTCRTLVLLFLPACGFITKDELEERLGMDSASDTALVPAAAEPCGVLTDPVGSVIEVGPEDDWEAAIEGAVDGDTVRLGPGTYIPGGLITVAHDVAVRGTSGETVIEAAGRDILFRIQGPGFTLGELEVHEPGGTVLHLDVGAGGAGSPRYLVSNLSVTDLTRDPVLRADLTTGSGGPDDLVLECSRFEALASDADCNLAAIRARGVAGWIVRDNHFQDFDCDGLASPTVKFDQGSRDAQIIRNTFVNSDRAIQVGGEGDETRAWPDPCDPSDPLDHASVVANNFIAAAGSIDNGIAVQPGCHVNVAHNTVFFYSEPFSTIEWRFAGAYATIQNNLTSHALYPREGAVAEASGNVEGARDWFVDALTGDLHLDLTADIAEGVLDAGALVESAATDFDDQARESPVDIGADEI